MSKSQRCGECGQVVRGPLAQALDELARETGVSMGMLADRIGISDSAFNAYRLGHRAISVEMLGRIESALRVPSGTLMSRAGLVESEAGIVQRIAENLGISPIVLLRIAGNLDDQVAQARQETGT